MSNADVIIAAIIATAADGEIGLVIKVSRTGHRKRPRREPCHARAADSTHQVVSIGIRALECDLRGHGLRLSVKETNRT
jgi:hypothetical protein